MGRHNLTIPFERSADSPRLNSESAAKEEIIMDVERMVRRAKKGNWEAYLGLALDKKDLLYHKALSLLGNEHDAADAVEEALVKGYDSIISLQQAQYFQTWLVRILINTCIDIQRKRQKTVSLETYAVNKEPVFQPNIDDNLDIQRQLEDLDEKHRTVLILRYYEDLKVEEIAQVLSLPPGTVKSRLFWALKKMRHGIERGQTYEM